MPDLTLPTTPRLPRRGWGQALLGMGVYAVTFVLAWAGQGSLAGGFALTVCLFVYPMVGLGLLIVRPVRALGWGLLAGSTGLWAYALLGLDRWIC